MLQLRAACIRRQPARKRGNQPSRSFIQEGIKRTHRDVLHLAHDMGIDHGGLNAFMAEKFLDLSDVDSLHQKMGCKAITKGMNRGMFNNGCASEVRKQPF